MNSLLTTVMLVLVTSFSTMAVKASGPPAGEGSYEDLIDLSNEFVMWREGDHPSRAFLEEDSQGHVISALADNRPAAIAARLEALGELQRRMSTMNVAGWGRSRQVDWLALRSRLDQQEFLLRLARPWARDPGYYVDRMLWLTFTDLPAEAEARAGLIMELRSIPVLVAEAKEVLSDVASDYADLALHNLRHSDGVGHGHPRRDTPPAGVLGWYEDLLARAKLEQPELVTDIEAARDAVLEFDAWLDQRRPHWNAPAGSGKAAFDWYLKHVKLMPWTSDELVVLGNRELDRLWALYALEQHRNQSQKPLLPAASAQQYEDLIAATDARIRDFLKTQEIITVPEDVGRLDTNVPWQVRPQGRNFWEEVQYRDPSPDHLHAVIPGHRFDAVMARRSNHPIRQDLTSAARVEGWATYLEEAMLQAGLFEDNPRVRELIQVFGIFRAARVPVDVWLQSGQMSAAQAVEFWMARVPYLDENVARVDAEIYLRRPPGYGIGYSVGKLQVERMLADRKRQLGDAFILKDFHDYLMTAGRLPVSLLRWELTGIDDDVSKLWSREPLPLN